MKFPKDFYWGAATSAHQVEGGNNNDWSVWEKENSARLAKEALNKDYPKHVLNDYPGPFRRENYISGRASDHYNRYNEDFDIAKSLGHNAHRFSIEWSRIEPEEGKFNEAEIEHYRKVINALRSRGIEPFITLWHFTNPLWISKIGGWANNQTVFYFTRYAERMAKELGKDVKFWITINEPMVYAGNAYRRGIWPPAGNAKSLLKYIMVLRNFVLAHKRAYKKIKKINPGAQIGIAKNNIYFDGSGINAPLKFLADWWWNEMFLNFIENEMDFIGLNYYFHNRIKGFRFNQNINKDVSDMGWELCPEGIYKILSNLTKYKKQIFITENGLADAKDNKRADFIREHLKWIKKAMGTNGSKGKERGSNGANVRGYFHWSLLDNFEWDKGFWPRFGLVEVDYNTMQRKIRSSAYQYKKSINESQNLNKK
ncbi:MAG: glycoside hydrolase family 1 protein [Patescibacteria group bacterium]